MKFIIVSADEEMDTCTEVIFLFNESCYWCFCLYVAFGNQTEYCGNDKSILNY